MQMPILKLKSNVLTLSYSQGDLDCKQALAQLQSSKQSAISGDDVDDDDGDGDDGDGDDDNDNVLTLTW